MKNDDLMKNCINRLVNNAITLHHFLIRILAKKEMAFKLAFSFHQ